MQLDWSSLSFNVRQKKYMGTWGHKTFENDYALDWVADLPANGWQHVESTLANITSDKKHWPDTPYDEEVVAAVASVLVALGECMPDFIEQVPGWDNCPYGIPPPILIAKAKRAVTYLLTESELRDRCESEDDLEAWMLEVTQLKNLISKYPSPEITEVESKPWWRKWFGATD
jgi:hypothetical protein